jgi:hypothetical protein
MQWRKMEIISNGSKWKGEPLGGLEELHRRLKTNTLDPTFEEFGNFVPQNTPAEVRVWGNFCDVSHVFCIQGTRAELSATIRLIRANQRTKKYREAKGEHLAWEEAEARREQEREEARRRTSRPALLARG